MPFGNRKIYFRGSFQFSIVKIKKKYQLSGNLKFKNFGIFQSLKFRILIEKIFPISLRAKFHSKFGLLRVKEGSESKLACLWKMPWAASRTNRHDFAMENLCIFAIRQENMARFVRDVLG